MRTSSRDSYTKAVDLWALGAVIHEILTTEIPFLEIYEDLDEELADDLGSMRITPEEYTACDSWPTIDSEILYDFCRGSEFPIESLRKHSVSDEGIDFVKSLMVANPRNRVSAVAALESPWMVGLELLNQLRLLGVYLGPERSSQLPQEMYSPMHSPVASDL